MTPDQAQQQLLHALDAHSTVLKEEDIVWAFDAKNTQTAVVDWVEEFLGPETLLSKEELELYSKLEKNGAARRIAADHDLALVRPFFDDEIKTALKSLKDSTSAIERHNQFLKQQQEALFSFRKSNDQTREHWKRVAAQRQRKRAQEKQSLEFAVEELLQTVSSNAEAAQRNLRTAKTVFPSTLAESLQKDGRTLARIDRLARELKVSDTYNGQQTARPRILCEKMSMYIADEIRCRLDRIYLETSQSSAESSTGFSRDEAELELSLKAELDTLYSEITAVAQMSTSLEFEKPLNEAARQNNAHNERRIASVLDHIDNSVTYMLEKMEHLITRAQVHSSHRKALNVVGGVLQGLQTSKPQSRSSVNDKASNLPSQPALTTQSRLETYGATYETSNDCDPRRLLRVLGVPSPDGLEPGDVEDVIGLTAIERERKLRDVSSSVENAVDQMTASCLNDSSFTQQILVDALLADTAYHNVEMFDIALRSEINALEAHISETGAAMAHLDLERLKVANQERDQFVNRWAHD